LTVLKKAAMSAMDGSCYGFFHCDNRTWHS
jgi:hypothetical protein